MLCIPSVKNDKRREREREKQNVQFMSIILECKCKLEIFVQGHVSATRERKKVNKEEGRKLTRRKKVLEQLLKEGTADLLPVVPSLELKS